MPKEIFFWAFSTEVGFLWNFPSHEKKPNPMGKNPKNPGIWDPRKIPSQSHLCLEFTVEAGQLCFFNS